MTSQRTTLSVLYNISFNNKNQKLTEDRQVPGAARSPQKPPTIPMDTERFLKARCRSTR